MQYVSFWKVAARGLALVAALLVVAPARADDAKEHFDKGIALYNQKKPADALAEFALAQKTAPNDPVILYWIGFINLQERKYEEAREPLEKAVQIKPDAADAHLNLGNVYDGLKRYADAVREFETVAKLQPKSADAYYNLGSVYYKMKRLPDSITAYRRAVALNPTDAYVQDSLGFVLQASNRLPEAITAYQAATKLQPNNPNFWADLAQAEQESGRRSLATEKGTADKAWTEARAAMARAVQFAPNSYALRETYAEMLFDMGRNADAVPQFEKAAQLDPKQFNPLYNLGLAQTRLGSARAAVEAYRRALTVRPESRDAQHGLGLAQFRAGQYAESAATFTQLTKSDPNDVTAWINLSSSLQRKNDAEGAVAALEEAVKHGTKGARVAMARRALAAYYYRKGDTDSLTRAQEEYNRSLQEAPNNPEALNGLGLIAQKQKRVDEALDYFKQAVAANPRYSDAYNNLGVAYEFKGNTEQAIAGYRKALQIDPNNTLAKRNLARLEKTASGKNP